MPIAERSSGKRSVMPQQTAGGGLAAGEPDLGDFADPEGSENTVITIGPADSKAVQDAAMVGGAMVSTDANGQTVVDFNPPANPKKAVNTNDAFGRNIADAADEMNLDRIAVDLFEGIEADSQSRGDQIQTYTNNMDMLGLKIERGNGAGGADGQSVSNVRHPVLLESIVKFQAAASPEMLPAAGPCKVMNDADDSIEEDEVAQALEKDMNWYLTKVATEYYPDTDQANFYLGYGGTIFKKIYKCPVRRRPVSEAVYIPDLIISNDATDIQNANRVTHVLRYLRSDVKRMENMKIWRKLELAAPVSKPTITQTKEGQISGVTPQVQRQPDIPRIIYECYTSLYLPEYSIGAKEKGQPDGLPIPYRVTLDLESRKVLEIRRDWKQGDDMFMRKRHFVKFGLIPGFGFYNLGFLHLIGNQTKALTAIWRILVDAGMFSNFPGGVMVQGVRLNNNIIRPNPGEFIPIQTGPAQDITKAFLPMPYKEPSAVLLQLAQMIGEDAERMSGAVQLEAGEGRTNVPVGTIMAQIEQQTQVMQSVHKRLHRAQGEELQCLLDLFREDPTMLWKFFGDKKPERQWMTAEEFNNLRLVPKSDPNVPAQVHRIMLAVALTMLAAQNTAIYDQLAVNKRVLAMINVQDTDELLMTPEKAAAAAASAGAPPPDPKVMAATIQAQAKQQEGQMKLQQSQQDLKGDALRAGAEMAQQQQESKDQEQDRQSRETVAQMNLEKEQMKAKGNDIETGKLNLQHSVEDHKAAKIHHDIAMDHENLALQKQQQDHQQQVDKAGIQQQQQAQQAQQGAEIAGLANERAKIAQGGLNGSGGLGSAEGAS